MANKFFDEGNLGTDPEIKFLEEGSDDKVVCNLRIYFDRPVPNDDNGFDDKGGFWMSVEIWGKRAIRCHELLKKGHRVSVEGSIIGKSWIDSDSQKQEVLVVRARRVNPDIMMVDSLATKSD